MRGRRSKAADERADPARTIRYVPALDGVRALAITAVVLLHGGVSWAQGGYLGVDVFFVLSGYLITTLLLAEHRRTGRIGLGHFWANRARRLLPGLLAMLVLVAAYAAYLAPAGTREAIRGDAIATLLYFANWHHAFGGPTYFAQLAAPSPLLHTWSLAIEEQFYLVWPLVVVACLRTSKWRPLLLLVTGVGAIASAVEMAILFHGGSGLNRAYYGTDTRAQALLIGAFVAVVLAGSAPADPAGAERSREPRCGWAAFTAGALCVGFLAWLVVSATGSNGQAPDWMFDGGFAAAAIAAAALVACVVVAPRSLWARALSLSPIRYVGTISYGLYLWHVPIFLIVDHARTGLLGAQLFGARVGVTFATSVASYHLLERPIRRGVLQTRLATWTRWALVPALCGATAGLVLAATVTLPGNEALASASFPTPRPTASKLAAGVTSLLAVHAADAAGPIRVLMVGDSLPVTLDFGLGPAGPSFGIDLESDAVIGCGLVVVGLVTNLGTTAPETGGLRDSQLIQCSTWPRRWRNDETTFHPDVSVLLDGVWEVRDREIDGHWTHIGEPAFDRQELAALNRAVDVLGSTGSKVVLLTCPYLSQPEQADGQPWPDDNPARVNTYNRLLDKVAAEHRGVEVIDLGAYVSPGGRYSPVVDGIDVRDPDGLHFSLAGGKFVAPWLLPQLYSVGVAHRSETQPLTADPLAGPSPDPYPGS